MSAASIPERLTIGWLRRSYAAGAVTPAEVVDEIVRRARADAAMNIWISPPDRASIEPHLARLRTLDPARAPLWGVPFAVKDNIDLAGVPTTAACPAYAYTPAEHAPAVARLLAAGAIPVGKTNLDQFATGLVGTRSPYGETHNALRPELISGGSSSGSAVAVARGHAAFALGTDTAGSGRVPAALNGLIGFKPSLGAWPVKGVVPACASLDCVTVFAHELEDALAVDRAVRGAHPDDPWSRETPAVALRLPQRILLPQRPPAFYGPFADGYRAAWEAAAERLAALGAELGAAVERIDLAPFEEAAALLYEGPWVAERWAGLGEFVAAHPGAALEVTERILRSGADEAYGAAAVFRAAHRLRALKQQTRRLLADAVLALPTAGGTWTREQVRHDPIGANREMGRYTNHCNLLDLCAVAVPAGEAAPRTPFGLTLFALAGDEGLACGLAGAFLAKTAARPTVRVAVCGLHMRGYPLERQMRECEARFVREDRTIDRYRLYRLPTAPPKPGLVKQPAGAGGSSIALEVWEMPLDRFGEFVSLVPAPLGIGRIELADGTEVPGFLCENYAALGPGAEDVTAYGGWRNVPKR